MESIESIRVEQPAINHTMIRHAEQLCFYARQTAGGNKRLCVCIYVSVRDREGEKQRQSECDRQKRQKATRRSVSVYARSAEQRKVTDYENTSNKNYTTFSPVKDPSAVTAFMKKKAKLSVYSCPSHLNVVAHMHAQRNIFQ